MFNRKFANFNSNFDPQIYEFEKKKQNLENKIKAREKMQQEKDNQISKIQINFKNEFVNAKTQKKYDELIQNNNKKNHDKLEEKSTKKNNIIRETSSTYVITEKDCDKTNKNSVENTINNQSDLILIEQMSTQKSRADETYIKNNDQFENFSNLEKTDLNPLCEDTYVSATEENKNLYIHNDVKINSNEIEKTKKDNVDLSKNTESTLRYESEEDFNIKKEVQTGENPKETKNLNWFYKDKLDEFRINTNCNKNSLKNNSKLDMQENKLKYYIYQPEFVCHEQIYEKKDNTLKDFIYENKFIKLKPDIKNHDNGPELELKYNNFSKTKKQNLKEDVTKEFRKDFDMNNQPKIFDEKFNPYNKFLEDTLEQSLNFNEFNSKNNVKNRSKRDETQEILLNQMKNIIHDIKGRKIELNNIKSEKKKLIFNNINSNRNEKIPNDISNDKTIEFDKKKIENKRSTNTSLPNSENSKNTNCRGQSYLINNTKENFHKYNTMDKTLCDKNEISKFFETRKSWKQHKDEILFNTLNKEKENNIFNDFKSDTKINFIQDQENNQDSRNNDRKVEKSSNSESENRINIEETKEKAYHSPGDFNIGKNYPLKKFENYQIYQKQNNLGKGNEDGDYDDFFKENIDEIDNQNYPLDENELSSIHQSIKEEDLKISKNYKYEDLFKKNNFKYDNAIRDNKKNDDFNPLSKKEDSKKNNIIENISSQEINKNIPNEMYNLNNKSFSDNNYNEDKLNKLTKINKEKENFFKHDDIYILPTENREGGSSENYQNKKEFLKKEKNNNLIIHNQNEILNLDFKEFENTNKNYKNPYIDQNYHVDERKNINIKEKESSSEKFYSPNGKLDIIGFKDNDFPIEENEKLNIISNDVIDENNNKINRFNLDYDIIGNEMGNLQAIEYQNLDLKNQEPKYQKGEDSNDLIKFQNKVIEFGNYSNEEDYQEKLRKLESKKQKKIEEIKERNRTRSKSNPKYRNKYREIEENEITEDKFIYKNDNPQKSNKMKKAIIERKNKSSKKIITKEDLNFKNDLNYDLKNINQNINYMIHKINTKSKDEKASIAAKGGLQNSGESKGKISTNTRIRQRSKIIKRNSLKLLDSNDVNKNLIDNHLGDFSSEQLSEINRIPIKIVKDDSSNTARKIKNVNYVKHSNKKIIKNAISTVCLAGETNRSYREKILEIIDKCPCENFIILFKGNFGRFDLKAVYTHNPQLKKVELLTCLSNSPLTFTDEMVTRFYKYDIIQKDFKLLGQTREISVIIDAVAINKIEN